MSNKTLVGVLLILAILSGVFSPKWLTVICLVAMIRWIAFGRIKTKADWKQFSCFVRHSNTWILMEDEITPTTNKWWCYKCADFRTTYKP